MNFTHIQRYRVAMAVSCGLLTALDICNLSRAKNAYEQIFWMFFITLFFFISITWFSIFIENTQWYINIKKNRELDLVKEEIGEEPDPKDFEFESESKKPVVETNKESYSKE